MSKIKLNAHPRNKENKAVENKILAVIYGPNSKNQSLELDYKEFSQIYEEAGESSLVDLVIDDKNPVKVLIHAIQKDPVSDKYVHVDFYQLDMDKKLNIDVGLVFKGTEEVEKATAGEVIRNMDKLEVECLPKDLIKEIEIDLTEFLKGVGDTVHAKDIKLPTGLVLVTDTEAPIISAQEIKEEIIEIPKEEATEEEGEKEGEEGKEAEEGKEEAKPEEKDGEKKEEKKEEK